MTYSDMQAPWLQRALKDLREGGGLVLHLGPSAAQEQASQAWSAAWGGPCCRVDVVGCVDAPDLIRATGLALGLSVPGVTAAVAHALDADTLLIWLNLSAQDASVAASALQSLSTGLRTLGLGPRELPGAQTVGIAPPPRLSPPDALTLSPAGVPGEPTGPKERLRQGVPRVALRLELLEGHPPHPDPSAAAQELLPRAQLLLQLCFGEAMPAGLQHADLLFLRALCRALRPGLQRAQSAAAAARLIAASGQLPLARELLDAARPGSGARGSALLHWAEGDLLLRQGLSAAATGHHEAALHLLLPIEPTWAATMLRRSADALAGMGESKEAAARYMRARRIHRDSGDPLGVAASLRGAGDLAIQAGEVLSADALYEQAQAVLASADSDLGGANLSLGLAALATLRGEPAGPLLEQAERLGRTRPVIQAGVYRRRADIQLRSGKHGQAEVQLEKARALYLRAGEPHAAARCRRILADVAAAAGRLNEAALRYRQALTDSAQLGDLQGARQVLKHALVLERAGSDAARVEELLQQLAELDAEISSPGRQQAMRLG